MFDDEVTFLGQRSGDFEAVGAVAGPTLPGILALHKVQQRRVRVGSDEARLAHAGVVLQEGQE